MLHTPELFPIINLAARLHRTQVRKDELRTPYLSHLIGVAFLLRDHTEDFDVVAAGILHDALEDVEGYTEEKLAKDTNPRIASLVYSVTHDTHDHAGNPHNWLTQKHIYLAKLMDATPESSLIALADKVHNITSFLGDYANEGEPFRERFAGSATNQIWFYSEIHRITSLKLGESHPLLSLYRSTLAQFTPLFTSHI